MHKNSRWISVLSLLSISYGVSALPALSSHALSQLLSNQHQESLTGAEYYRLGQGYDLFMSQGKSQCLDPDVGFDYVGGASGSIGVFTDYAFNELLDKLGVSTNVEGGYQGFGANAAVNFARDATKTENALSIVYYYQADSYPLQLHQLQTHPSIHRYIVKEYGTFKAKDDITTVCGDHFISQIDLGASLMFNMRFSFSNAAAKQEVSTALGGDYLNFVKLKAAISNLSQETQLSTHVNLTAQQIGGDVGQLGTWLGGEYARCSLNDPDSCLQVMEKFFLYQREIFPKQLERDSDNKPMGYNWAVTGYHLTPFKNTLITYAGDDNPNKYGLFLTPGSEVKPDPQVLAMREQLIQKYSHWVELDQTYQSAKVAASGDTEKLTRLAEVKSVLSNNMSVIQKAGQQCFIDPEQCLALGNDALKQQQPLDREALNLTPTVRQGDIVNQSVITDWAFTNANLNNNPEQGATYIYMPDFGVNGMIEQGVSLKAGYHYVFDAQLQLEPKNTTTTVQMSIINADTDEVLAVKNLSSDVKKKAILTLDYTPKGGTESSHLLLRITAEQGLVKVFKVSNRELE